MFLIAIVINVIMAGTGCMEYMLSMINALQLIIHLPLMKIILPSNVMMFFSIILPFVMFDILDADYTTALWFDFEEKPP
jgi:hypothetical protein